MAAMRAAVFRSGASIDAVVLYTYNIISIYPYINTDGKEDDDTYYIARTSVLENVQHPTHLAKAEHPRAPLLRARKQLVEDKHLARVLESRRSARQRCIVVRVPANGQRQDSAHGNNEKNNE